MVRVTAFTGRSGRPMDRRRDSYALTPLPTTITLPVALLALPLATMTRRAIG